MPEVSRFFGIVIFMYYDDHNPPHFHVRYGESKAIIGIKSLNILRGQLGKRACKKVMDWAEINRSALAKNWELARGYKPLISIKPLE